MTFRSSFAEANKEFLSLLRDVHTESHDTLPGDTRGQQVSELLVRAVRCCHKEYLLQAELGNLASPTTHGLYNRRGFMALAERQLKLGRRSGREMLFLMDVDRLEADQRLVGHLEATALKRTAGVWGNAATRRSELIDFKAVKRRVLMVASL